MPQVDHVHSRRLHLPLHVSSPKPVPPYHTHADCAKPPFPAHTSPTSSTEFHIDSFAMPSPRSPQSPRRPKPSRSLPPLPHQSCPSLSIPTSPPSPPSPSAFPVRRKTLPTPPSLPLLDLSTLPSVTAGGIPDCPETARKSVDAITASLSAVTPYLQVGSQASLLGNGVVSQNPTHIITFVASTTPQFDRRRHITANAHIHARASIPAPPHQLNTQPQQPQQPRYRSPQTIAFPLRDDVHQRIDHVFLPVARLIDAARDGGGCAALVCAQGISRSATCGIAYLMLREGLSLDDALSAARKARPIVAPNAAFMQALVRLERRLRTGRLSDSVSVVRDVSCGGAGAGASFRDAFYDGERRGVTLEGCTGGDEFETPYVAEEVLEHGPTWLQVGRGDDVVVIEHARRGGVTVWHGRYTSNQLRTAGVRLANNMAKQQLADLKRFKGPAIAPGIVNVFTQGESRRVDENLEKAFKR